MPDADELSGPADRIVIDEDLEIPEAELSYRFSRSGGPGGQHVNRSETRVELLFNVAQSPSLNESQRARILQRLGRAIDAEGVLRVVSSTTRSQAENRADALARFQALLKSALHRRKKRIATRPSVASRERRLTAKRTRSTVKRTRRSPLADDG